MFIYLSELSEGMKYGILFLLFALCLIKYWPAIRAKYTEGMITNESIIKDWSLESYDKNKLIKNFKTSILILFENIFVLWDSLNNK